MHLSIQTPFSPMSCEIRMEFWDTIAHGFEFGGGTNFMPTEDEIEDCIAVVPKRRLLFVASGHGIAVGLADSYFSGAAAARHLLGLCLGLSCKEEEEVRIYPKAAEATVLATRASVQRGRLPEITGWLDIFKRAGEGLGEHLKPDEHSWMYSHLALLDLSSFPKYTFLSAGDYRLYRLGDGGVDLLHPGGTLLELVERDPELQERMKIARLEDPGNMLLDPSITRSILTQIVNAKGLFKPEDLRPTEGHLEEGEGLLLFNHGLRQSLVDDDEPIRAALHKNKPLSFDMAGLLAAAAAKKTRRLSMHPTALTLLPLP